MMHRMRLFGSIAAALVLALAVSAQDAGAAPRADLGAGAPADGGSGVSADGGAGASADAGAGSRADGGAGATKMIKLRDGSILWARIESHTSAELELVRADTGGRVALDWGRLDPAQARELQIDFGYLDPNGGEVLVTADQVPLTDGRSVIGKIVNHAPDALHLKTAQSLLQLPLSRIAGPATQVQVPALDIYTKQELYQQKQLELATGLAAEGAVGAEAAFELARYCEKILDFAGAAKHYAETAAKDPQFKPAEVAAARSRASTKAALQEQVDAIAAIDLERKRENFDKALALSKAFVERWPESPLMPEWKKSKDRLDKARERYLKQQVALLWHRESERLSRAAAQKYSFAQCVEYAGSLLAQETLDAVTTALQKSSKSLEPASVNSMWDTREKRGTHRASYGLGTWLLGEERARKDLDKKKDGEKKPELPKAATSEQQKIAEALKRYMDNQAVARKAAGAGAQNSEDAEAFWREQTVGARVQWMLAYHAEYGGTMQVVTVQGENCPECAGKGATEQASGGIVPSTQSNSGGGNRSGQTAVNSASRLVPCNTCKHTGVIRRVVYR
jgi:hypothetical protein